jgi:hypothetical protein
MSIQRNGEWVSAKDMVRVLVDLMEFMATDGTTWSDSGDMLRAIIDELRVPASEARHDRQ